LSLRSGIINGDVSPTVKHVCVIRVENFEANIFVIHILCVRWSLIFASILLRSVAVRGRTEI
jgi:hypothetical protein